MTERELFHKNAVLNIEFNKYLLEHPSFAEKIPDNALVVLLPEDDPEFCQENLKIAEKRKEKGQKVVRIRIKKMAPC